MPVHATVPAVHRSLAPAHGRAGTIALWALQIALAAALGGAGAAKLAAAPEMVQLFDAIGVGQWFRYVTGALELVGAILLLVPAASAGGAVLLAAVMGGAVLSHLILLHNSPAVPLALLAGLGVVLYARRAEIAVWLHRGRG